MRLKELKIELMNTLANELNNNKWEFDNYTVASAATDHISGKLVLILTDTDGVAIETCILTLSRERRRKHVTRRKSKGTNKKHSRT